MKIILAILSLAAAITHAQGAEPAVTRTAPNRIVVSGATYASIVPFRNTTEIIMEGTGIGFGVAWAIESLNLIVYAVDPYTDYTITATVIEGVNDDQVNTRHEFQINSDPLVRFEWMVLQRLYWERRYRQALIDDGITLEQARDAVIRMNEALENGVTP